MSMNAAIALLWLAVAGGGLQTEAVKFTPPEGGDFNSMGQSVSISGNSLVIADPHAYHGGAVMVYQRGPEGWTFTQIERKSLLVTREYGESVSLGAGILVVGDPSWPWPERRTGRAFVYERKGGNWEEAQVLSPTGLEFGDGFGRRVATDGQTIVAGALTDHPLRVNLGTVFIYERQPTGRWTQVYEFTPPWTPEVRNGEHYTLGMSLDISGHTLVAGATNGSGAVYVFERKGNGWHHVAIIDNPNKADGGFARSIAVEGPLIVAGQTRSSQSVPGKALIFQRDTKGSWQLHQEIEASDGFGNYDFNNRFGSRVAINERRIAVSAPNGNAAGKFAGTIYLFEENESGYWEETRRMVPSDPMQQHVGSGGLALQRDLVIAGALHMGPPEGKGGAYLFEIELGAHYCNNANNSTGSPGVLTLTGSEEAAEKDLALSVRGCPPFAVGTGLIGIETAALFLGDGVLCVGPHAPRITAPFLTGAEGVAYQPLDLGADPLAGLIEPGVTRYFQVAYRDPGSGLNFTNAVALTFK